MSPQPASLRQQPLALSMGDSFHCFRGSVSRLSKRRFCSSWVTENQYLYIRMPELTSIRSHSGVWRMNSRYSLGSQNPYNMVRATFDALAKGNSPRMVAQRRGKKVADLLVPGGASAAESEADAAATAA